MEREAALYAFRVQGGLGNRSGLIEVKFYLLILPISVALLGAGTG